MVRLPPPYCGWTATSIGADASAAKADDDDDEEAAAAALGGDDAEAATALGGEADGVDADAAGDARPPVSTALVADGRLTGAHPSASSATQYHSVASKPASAARGDIVATDSAAAADASGEGC